MGPLDLHRCRPPAAAAARPGHPGRTPRARRGTARPGAPASPGPVRSRGPPPTIAAYEVVWWGARNGRVRGVRRWPRPVPATLRMTATSCASASSSGGRSAGRPARGGSCRRPASPPAAGCGRPRWPPPAPSAHAPGHAHPRGRSSHQPCPPPGYPSAAPAERPEQPRRDGRLDQASNADGGAPTRAGCGPAARPGHESRDVVEAVDADDLHAVDHGGLLDGCRTGTQTRR